MSPRKQPASRRSSPLHHHNQQQHQQERQEVEAADKENTVRPALKLRLKLQQPAPEAPKEAGELAAVEGKNETVPPPKFKLKLRCKTPQGTPVKKAKRPARPKTGDMVAVDHLSEGEKTVQPDPQQPPQPRKRGRPKGSVNKKKKMLMMLGAEGEGAQVRVKRRAEEAVSRAVLPPRPPESEADRTMWRLIREFIEARLAAMSHSGVLQPFASRPEALRRLWPFYETLATVEASPSLHYRSAMQAALDISSDARLARFEQTLSAIRSRALELAPLPAADPVPRELACVVSRFLLQEDVLICERSKAEFMAQYGSVSLLESIMRPAVVGEEPANEAPSRPTARPPLVPQPPPPQAMNLPCQMPHRPKLLPKVLTPTTTTRPSAPPN